MMVGIKYLIARIAKVLEASPYHTMVVGYENSHPSQKIMKRFCLPRHYLFHENKTSEKIVPKKKFEKKNEIRCE